MAGLGGLGLKTARELRAQGCEVVAIEQDSHNRFLTTARSLQIPVVIGDATLPETLEAGLMIAAHVLERLDVPAQRIQELVRRQRATHYPLLRAHFEGEVAATPGEEQLEPVTVSPGSSACGRSLAELGFGAGEASALVRNGERTLDPPPSTRLEAGDTVVLRGPGDAVARGRDRLAGN